MICLLIQIRLIALYLPHGADNITDLFLLELKTVINDCKSIIIIGDMNLPRLNWNLKFSTKDKENKLLKLLTMYGPFDQFINFSTRENEVFDIILTNMCNQIVNISSFSCGYKLP